MIITKHAEQRTKQRVGLSRRALKRMIQKIVNEGLTIEQMSPELRFYVQSKIHPEDAAYIRVWGNNLYIIKGDHLVTVFIIPGRVKC
jgi:hypothetical protein